MKTRAPLRACYLTWQFYWFHMEVFAQRQRAFGVHNAAQHMFLVPVYPVYVYVFVAAGVPRSYTATLRHYGFGTHTSAAEDPL